MLWRGVLLDWLGFIKLLLRISFVSLFVHEFSPVVILARHHLVYVDQEESSFFRVNFADLCHNAFQIPVLRLIRRRLLQSIPQQQPHILQIHILQIAHVLRILELQVCYTSPQSDLLKCLFAKHIHAFNVLFRQYLHLLYQHRNV